MKSTIHEFVLRRIPEQTPDWISKGYTLFFILFLVLIFAGISVIPTLIASFFEGKFLFFSIMLSSYLCVLLIFWKQKMNYYLRSYILCFLFLIVGFASFDVGSLTSSGRLWFLASAAIACLLINLRAAFIFFSISLISILSISYSHDYKIIIPFKDESSIWIMTTFTFVLINILIVGSIYLIVNSLRKEEKKTFKLQKQLIQSQKLESIGKLTGGIAHDFNNMLLLILAHTEFALEKTEDNTPIYNDLIEIQTAGKKSASLTRQLLTFARKQIIKPKVIDLNETITSMLKLLKQLIGENIDIDWIPRENINLIHIDPSQIDQILANLSVNSRDAMSEKKTGKITIETDQISFDKNYCKKHPDIIPGSYIQIIFSDNGCGISSDNFDKIFDPFFTTKKQREGTGLGLSTVYGIIKQNNGFLNVYSEKGIGTTFKIYLPVYQGSKDKEKIKIEVDTDLLKGDETILIVEDDKSILNLIKTILSKKEYHVSISGSPTKAIEISKNISKIDLLITDIVMPEMNGPDLAKEIIKIHPKIKILYMSGYTENVIVHQGIVEGNINFIQKPFSTLALVQKIRKCLDT